VSVARKDGPAGGAVPGRSAPVARDGLIPTSAIADLTPRETFDLEVAHGNGDLMRLLDVLGVAGTLRPVSPWEVEDDAGRRLIHAGSYAATPFGENYPPITDFAKRFFDEPLTVGLPQQSASPWRAALEANLVRLLAREAPSHADSRVFLSNSGAEAIETAVKFARAARPKGTTFINFERAYHGKTYAALSLTPNEEYQALFRPLMGAVRTVPFGNADALARAVADIGPERVTAIVIEPVQGEAGVIVPPPGYLRRVGEIAKAHGITVIADEIQSGLGRCGAWFVSVAEGLEPDIVTLAKPLGGGLVPVGATIARNGIFMAMLRGLACKRHSSTFGGGAFASAIAARSLEVIADEGLVEKARADGEYGLARLREIQARHAGLIAEVRGRGLLFAIQFRPIMPSRLLPIDPEVLPTLVAFLGLLGLHHHGVHACYSNNAHGVARLTPPLTIPRELLSTMFDRVDAMAAEHGRSMSMLRMLSMSDIGRLLRLAL
jgi:acetylornithine/succinyldiaminopimelate/putrescine aminotransferase